MCEVMENYIHEVMEEYIKEHVDQMIADALKRELTPKEIACAYDVSLDYVLQVKENYL